LWVLLFLLLKSDFWLACSGPLFLFGVDGVGGVAAFLQTGLGVAQLGVCSVWWWFGGIYG
jgi:hypothetical protein